MKGPSAHLSWSEMACRDAARTPYPEAWRSMRAPVVARTFERIRRRLAEATGRIRPIEVGSCYRTPEHNREIGCAARSMHLEGLAIDLHTPEGCSVEQLLAAAEASLSGSRGGIFAYAWGIHVDRRDYLGKPPARGDFRVSAPGTGETSATGESPRSEER